MGYVDRGESPNIFTKSAPLLLLNYKNSSGDEIANVNVYAVRPEATRIR